MIYKIIRLTQMLDTDSIHVAEIEKFNLSPQDAMAKIMNMPNFKGKAVGIAPVWNYADEEQQMAAITTEASPVGEPSQFIFAHCCVPESMDLTVGKQLEKLLEIQL
jgi:hypothetical protein